MTIHHWDSVISMLCLSGHPDPANAEDENNHERPPCPQVYLWITWIQTHEIHIPMDLFPP